MEEFEKDDSQNMQQISHQRKIGTLADGSIITARSLSKSGLPVLEIFNAEDQSHKKIRYES